LAHQRRPPARQPGSGREDRGEGAAPRAPFCRDGGSGTSGSQLVASQEGLTRRRLRDPRLANTRTNPNVPSRRRSPSKCNRPSTCRALRTQARARKRLRGDHRGHAGQAVRAPRRTHSASSSDRTRGPARPGGPGARSRRAPARREAMYRALTNTSPDTRTQRMGVGCQLEEALFEPVCAALPRRARLCRRWPRSRGSPRAAC
jgi:hypothetical protein